MEAATPFSLPPPPPPPEAEDDPPPPPPPDEDESAPPPPPPEDEDEDAPPPPPEEEDEASSHLIADVSARAYQDAYFKALQEAGYDVSAETWQSQNETAEGYATHDAQPEQSQSQQPEPVELAAPEKKMMMWPKQQRRWRPAPSASRSSAAPSRGGAHDRQRQRIGMYLQRCQAWGQTGKCKKGYACAFAHGDDELAPKEVRAQKRKLDEENRMASEAMLDKVAIRQRVVADGGAGPSYGDYEQLAAAAQQKAVQRGESSSSRGERSVGEQHDGPLMHRPDGTPLEFSTRTAKVEAKKQYALEKEYESLQQQWGLPLQQQQQGSSTASASVGGASTATLPRPPRGRGRAVIRPAWLTRRESAI